MYPQSPVSLVPCDSYHPALSFNYQVLVPLIMIDYSLSFRDFNNADFYSLTMALVDNDWSTTFNIQTADISSKCYRNLYVYIYIYNILLSLSSM